MHLAGFVLFADITADRRYNCGISHKSDVQRATQSFP